MPDDHPKQYHLSASSSAAKAAPSGPCGCLREHGRKHCLATLHNPTGPYDPGLAVLTAALVALVWYTCFTFQAVHKGGPIEVAVMFNPELHPGRLALTIEPWSGRPLHLVTRLHVQVWLDGKALELDDFLSGRDPFPMASRNTHEFHRSIELHGPNPNEALFRVWLSWEDEDGGTGETLVQRWRTDVLRGLSYSVVGQAELDRFFDNDRVSASDDT
jgi:hypothetical protein